jgi:hypothetical protein
MHAVISQRGLVLDVYCPMVNVVLIHIRLTHACSVPLDRIIHCVWLVKVSDIGELASCVWNV